jgi:hypothetical protein
LFPTSGCFHKCSIWTDKCSILPKNCCIVKEEGCLKINLDFYQVHKGHSIDCWPFQEHVRYFDGLLVLWVTYTYTGKMLGWGLPIISWVADNLTSSIWNDKNFIGVCLLSYTKNIRTLSCFIYSFGVENDRSAIYTAI